MNVNGKTKDNEKVRMDLALYCSRPDIELKPLANGKRFKPKANYSLSIKEATLVYRWIKEFRMSLMVIHQTWQDVLMLKREGYMG